MFVQSLFTTSVCSYASSSRYHYHHRLYNSTASIFFFFLLSSLFLFIFPTTTTTTTTTAAATATAVTASSEQRAHGITSYNYNLATTTTFVFFFSPSPILLLPANNITNHYYCTRSPTTLPGTHWLLSFAAGRRCYVCLVAVLTLEGGADAVLFYFLLPQAPRFCMCFASRALSLCRDWS